MNEYDIQRRRNIKLLLEYDGSGYHGWQRQAGSLSIQEVVESRLGVMLGDKIGVRASGRTDAGVHARGQVVNFYCRSRLGPDEILRGLNSLLPEDIVVLEAEEVEEAFHSRFSAISKIYEYHILNRPVASALLRKSAWHVRQPLLMEPMLECLSAACGQRDFASFMTSGSAVSSTVRNLLRAELHRPGPDYLKLIFEGDGFLRHMVRNLTGTIVEVGRGKRTPDDFVRILSEKDRRKAGMTAPAHGLYLMAVNYAKDGVKPGPERLK
ncbi:MAG: tRNA pseudouridine(38-40) synthase TruA [Syntrophobacteraceae bacterium]